mmetsp:Transcript_6243/g.19692  ORF Transcript_6243/g.19692 Transcript_6243/m.19692 type:complete len:324 (-) Transcript_6243:937-1908(-)
MAVSTVSTTIASRFLPKATVTALRYLLSLTVHRSTRRPRTPLCIALSASSASATRVLWRVSSFTKRSSRSWASTAASSSSWSLLRSDAWCSVARRSSRRATQSACCALVSSMRAVRALARSALFSSVALSSSMAACRRSICICVSRWDCLIASRWRRSVSSPWRAVIVAQSASRRRPLYSSRSAGDSFFIDLSSAASSERHLSSSVSSRRSCCLSCSVKRATSRLRVASVSLADPSADWWRASFAVKCAEDALMRSSVARFSRSFELTPRSFLSSSRYCLCFSAYSFFAAAWSASEVTAALRRSTSAACAPSCSFCAASCAST